ncbi:MAG: Gfo/Idh/MocA family oxidoreductase [Cyclobacteriaceae bacterium]|nr:Gfo/Idh/MocA family oxidoreductase [Cyclobacteriaceae bacterium]
MGENLKRRKFLQKSVSGMIGLAGLPTIVSSHVLGLNGKVPPSDKIVMASIGVGGMGTGHVRSFIGYDDVQLVAVCDVRKEHRDGAKNIVDEKYGNSDCATYGDFRQLLSRKDIDGVVIATPEHWHALIGVEAARQHKDMYYEKPLSLSFAECIAMRNAVNRYKIVFQHGTQQRSDERFRFAVELARNGRIGNLEKIIIGSASYTPVPPQPEQPVPEGLDYDFWLGPAPLKPYTELRCTRNFTLISDYSLGCLSGAWGIHHVDIAQWTMDADKGGPLEVQGTAVIPEDGLYDTYWKFDIEHTYASGVKLLHMDHGTAKQKEPLYAHPAMGMLFVGSEGWILVRRGYIDAYPKNLLRTVIGPNEIQLPRSNDHRRNFLDAVKTRQEALCPIETAVRSDTVCHQADIAIRLGRKLRWDPVNETFINDPDANRLLSRPMRSPWHI